MALAAVITQSNYIPWKGYFDQMRSSDHFVVYDSVQYTRRDWRNRNLIKTPSGLKWLTIPVEVKGKFYQKINDTRIVNSTWAEKHWQILRQNYKKAKCFSEVESFVSSLYEKASTLQTLSEVNIFFLKELACYLEIESRFHSSEQFEMSEDRSGRLLDICKKLGVDTYISGPAAKCYLDETVFLTEGINVSWFDYSGYPEYPQLYGTFEHGVSVLDLIFSTGKEACHYINRVYDNSPSDPVER